MGDKEMFCLIAGNLSDLFSACTGLQGSNIHGFYSRSWKGMHGVRLAAVNCNRSINFKLLGWKKIILLGSVLRGTVPNMTLILKFICYLCHSSPDVFCIVLLTWKLMWRHRINRYNFGHILCFIINYLLNNASKCLLVIIVRKSCEWHIWLSLIVSGM